MPGKRKANHLVNNLQLVIFTITYLLSWLLLYGLFLWFTPEASIRFHVLATLALLILGVVFWAYLFVLFRVPHLMATRFDAIKNRVASGEIASGKEFSRELATFLPEFFEYAFCDVEHAAVKAGSTEPVFSDGQLGEYGGWEEIAKAAAGSDEPIGHGRIRIGRSVYRAYTIPIWFNDENLGFFTIFARQRLGVVRLKFFTDLEEHFIDDQLMLLTYREALNKEALKKKK